MSLSDNDPVQLDYKTYKRMVAAIRFVEAFIAGQSKGRGGSPPYNALLRAKSTTSIPGGTFAEPGEGQAIIYHYDQTEDEWYEAMSVDVINQFGGDAIAANTPLILAVISCTYCVISADCEPEEE